MFDCPDATHTSPITMFFTVIVFSPATVISTASPPAGIAPSTTAHFPSASAVADCFCRPSVTVTFSPESAFPQIGSALFAWRHMLSEMIAGSLTSARAESAAKATAAVKAARDLRIGCSFRWMGFAVSENNVTGPALSERANRSPPHEPGEGHVVRRLDHAALRDDRRHQRVRRHVERGVVHVHVRRRRLPAQPIRDFARV